tara:strand:- start:10156 stop:11994 length:1839 start_codon:yes stop_codon:yes gene_type:complete
MDILNRLKAALKSVNLNNSPNSYLSHLLSFENLSSDPLADLPQRTDESCNTASTLEDLNLDSTKAYNLIETSLTLDYRKGAWGIERIVLDDVSNHFPEDSKGTKIWVEFLQNDTWVDFRDYKSAKPVNAIRVRDDGKGFDDRLLDVLYSTKMDNGASVGQFGEGIKLISAACLRKGIDVEYMSRDWKARPYAKNETIDGEEFQRLCFSVEKDQPIINGSETLFNNPSEELIDEFRKLTANALTFNKKHEVLYTGRSFGYQPKIIDLKNGMSALYVKGMRMKKGLGHFIHQLGGFLGGFGNSDFDAIFSYDLGIEDISPDRQLADESNVKKSIRSLLLGCDNHEVLKRVLVTAYQNSGKDFVEYHALTHERMDETGMGMLGNGLNNITTLLAESSIIYNRFIPSSRREESNWSPGHETWKKVFYETFGEKAVLSSMDSDANKEATALGYNIVKINYVMEKFLTKTGVKSAKDLITTEREFKWVDKADLTANESSMLDLIPEIHRTILGEDLETNVKIYEGQYLITKNAEGYNLKVGEEIKTDGGFYTREDPENPDKDLIGIKRTQLETKHEFRKTYIHELGHKVTGEGDTDREFADFFVDTLARLIDKPPAHK